ncbi:Tet(A)/Tet(B)/Tet(C) family tetracycline efflux MFS transporter [Reyranella sp. CPCC 100927]|uniref:Tet(A)/Tet(B)/Tet(C) family tetracycline efflux MFS transporter n=1 Tax=Reyranella sp. CPCC 100927 TaxID=2599616 RepID=UPI0011B4C30E|nr:Tet(A)/Tet(B)/Tet(C) family tetracycline efflux MFS transporter [Reyranella sp. CPCC 100927]TWT11411.1 Tet(A)/Tet(B)/Tet(C) family tetracycline efflux MFS transporter [Reyranella sp. CPCC 100927]
MNKAIIVICATVALDAVGIGLIMPVLPGLLRNLVHSDHVAGHYGVLLSLYALMQVLCAPILGALSDRFGRRPVLLASLAGAAIDYAVMASAPVLWVLYLGRIVSGITGATATVAASCVADTTADAARARVFGIVGACTGGGLIAGPAIGGAMGSLSPQAPFVAAAVLNALAFLVACILLPETRAGARRGFSLAAMNPLAPFRWSGNLAAAKALIGVYFLVALAGQVPAALWVIFTEDRFHWSAATVGQSLAVFGALHVIAMAVVTGPLTAWLGERRALILSIVADGVGYVLLAFTMRGWLLMVVLVLPALGSIGNPALQALLSQRTSPQTQGALQGMLSSLAGMASIIGPLAFTALYAATAVPWNGWPWIAGALLCAISLLLLGRPPGPQPRSPGAPLHPSGEQR